MYGDEILWRMVEAFIVNIKSESVKVQAEL